MISIQETVSMIRKWEVGERSEQGGLLPVTRIYTVCKFSPQVPIAYHIYRNVNLLDIVDSPRNTLFAPDPYII